MIKDILEAEYIRGEGWSPSYLKIQNCKAARINVLGIVVEIIDNPPQKRVLIDDGTGRIVVENGSFSQIPENIEIGNLILVIGRTSESQTERIIFSEIIKLLDSLNWLKARTLEYSSKTRSPKKIICSKVEPEPIQSPNNTLPQKVYSLIKSMDKGEGVDIETLISANPKEQTEKIISNLLEEGEIFEVKPGRLKVL